MPAVLPEIDVVGVGPVDRPVATRAGAGLVARLESPPLRGLGRALGPTDVDDHPAPLDPNFTGAGRCLTDDGGEYRFITVKPGAYPWRNHDNAWRPAHVHFSLFGPALASRLVTQMYFPGDPLIPLDPILNSVPDPRGRELLISRFDLETTIPQWALGYRWDIVLRGRRATPVEP